MKRACMGGGARLGRLGWALDAGSGGYGVVSDSDRVGEISCAEGFGVGSVDLWVGGIGLAFFLFFCFFFILL